MKAKQASNQPPPIRKFRTVRVSVGRDPELGYGVYALGRLWRSFRNVRDAQAWVWAQYERWNKQGAGGMMPFEYSLGVLSAVTCEDRERTPGYEPVPLKYTDYLDRDAKRCPHCNKALH